MAPIPGSIDLAINYFYALSSTQLCNLSAPSKLVHAQCPKVGWVDMLPGLDTELSRKYHFRVRLSNLLRGRLNERERGGSEVRQNTGLAQID